MKIKIKTYNGELPSYLTVGKVYGGKELKSATTTANNIQIRATCIVGVMSK